MALMTGQEYIESIRTMKMEVYMFGKRVESPVDDPILRPSLNSVRMTYDLAQMPEYQDLMTTISPYTGKRINRFTHIHQSTEDLVKKVKMQRLLCLLYTSTNAKASFSSSTIEIRSVEKPVFTVTCT